MLEVPSDNRLWMYGTISNYEWDSQDAMSVYFLATEEDKPLFPVKYTAGVWCVLDMYNFALWIFYKVSGSLYRLPLILEKHAQLTLCILAFGNQKWDSEHNMRKLP